MSINDNLCDQIVSTLSSFGQDYMKKPDSNKAIINKLQESIAYYCNAEAKERDLDRKFAESVEKISNANTAEDAEIICKAFMKSNFKDPSNGTKDKRFEEFLNSRESSEDDNILIVQASANLVDPITKKVMSDPVMNTLCNHTYERSAVLQLIKKNSRTRCPMMGCSTYVEKINLVPNNEVKRLLESYVTDSSSMNDSQIVSLDVTETV